MGQNIGPPWNNKFYIGSYRENIKNLFDWIRKAYMLNIRYVASPIYIYIERTSTKFK